MHYAICNIHPFSPYPDPGTTKTQCIMRIMHYNNMHYENFDCISFAFRLPFATLAFPLRDYRSPVRFKLVADGKSDTYGVSGGRLYEP